MKCYRGALVCAMSGAISFSLIHSMEILSSRIYFNAPPRRHNHPIGQGNQLAVSKQSIESGISLFKCKIIGLFFEYRLIS